VGETVSFPVQLSADGTGPATHCGMSTVTTDRMFALLSRSVPFPEGIDEPAVNVLLDAMIMSRLSVPDPVEEEIDGEVMLIPQQPAPSQHFSELAAAHGLQKVSPPPLE
tara:strand:+ start:180 stop:506 length:327 start_codon:yes stop_codon:yes gene_type:complete